MSVKITTASNLIATTRIAGLSIFALDEIKELMLPHDMPCLMPHPKNFLSNFVTLPKDISNQVSDETYLLHYRLYYAPAVGTVKFFGPYAGLIAMTEKILNVFIDTDSLSGALYVKPRVEFVGGVEDHAGNIYHGGDFAFEITELYEVV